VVISVTEIGFAYNERSGHDVDMIEENILAIPGILSGIVFDTAGQYLFIYGHHANDKEIKCLFRTFWNIHRHRCNHKGPLRIAVSPDIFTCTVSASGDIFGNGESSHRTLLVLFRKERIIFFVGAKNSRISYVKLIDEVLGIHRNVDVVLSNNDASFIDRYKG
jgi:hypothetical protein